MQRVVTPVKMVIVECKCDQCNKGMMSIDLFEFEPIKYTAEYPHVCNFCGEKKILEDRYPYLSYRLGNEEGREIYRQVYEYG